MCGIIGYVGTQQALPLVMDGLRRMEYRGYDSAGVAVTAPDGRIGVARKAGVLANLEGLIVEQNLSLPGTTGIGHTRWATHGAPTDRNAHPHRDASGRVAVIHNGIIENFAQLRLELENRGVELTSDTDTEVVAHLLAAQYDQQPGDLPAAIAAVCRRLHGAFTLVAMHADAPGRLVAARRNSPLVVGVGEGEMFVASDVSAFIAHTREAVELGQDQLVSITADGFEVTSFSDSAGSISPTSSTAGSISPTSSTAGSISPTSSTAGSISPTSSTVAVYREFHVDWDTEAAEKGGFEFFMDKEIAEQPTAIADTLLGHFDGNRIVLDEQRLGIDELRTIDKVVVVGCGTAYHSGLLAKYAIEHWTRLPVEVELASEFRYRDPVLTRDTLVLAVSQSGETADTLEAVRHAREQKAKVLAVCNTNGSQIPRESDAVVYMHAGPEIGVASTKAFLGMVVANYLVGLAIAQARGLKYVDEIAHEFEAMEAIPAAVSDTLRRMDPVRALGKEISDSRAVLYLGRHVGYPVALEGALKLKELAYMHAEGFAAGELKHGPIALVEEGLPVVVITPSPRLRPLLHSKLVSNIREIQARGARTIVICEDGDDTVARFADTLIQLPPTPVLLQPLVATVPLQILAAEIARCRGYDIDKPRNLAKSVTVE